MRLLGQVHDITVPLPAEPLTPAALDAVKAAFEREYERLYTHVYTGTVIQAISWRVLCAGPAPSIDVGAARAASRPAALRSRGTGAAYFGDAGGWTNAPVYDRYALAPGQADRRAGHRRGARVHDGHSARRCGSTSTPRATCASTSGTPALRPRAGPAARGRPWRASRRDPIGLEIMWSRLINLVEECWLTVWRTAFSLIIGEAQDFGCEILDARGNSLAHSPRAMPVFNLTLPRAVRPSSRSSRWRRSSPATS